ncbi:MAG: hypothetical protein K5863_03155 [Nitratireductor sp.]|nr:hypothetical protein [Nitratireductor sp.]MCV0349044.1 hypothetical protein [Nitratireductor sp.]
MGKHACASLEGSEADTREFPLQRRSVFTLPLIGIESLVPLAQTLAQWAK